MHTSKIEWVLNPDNKTLGKIWNPITGCLNGCEYCYARRLANGRLKHLYISNTICAGYDADKMSGEQKIDILLDPFYPRFWPERLSDKGLSMCELSYKQRGIFVCDMGELFGDWIPEEWQRQIFEVIKYNWWHRFYLLTKQPQNLTKFSPFPDNCYIGVSVTRNNQLAGALKYLKQIQATVKFISFEPLLERIDLSLYIGYNEPVKEVNNATEIQRRNCVSSSHEGRIRDRQHGSNMESEESHGHSLGQRGTDITLRQAQSRKRHGEISPSTSNGELETHLLPSSSVSMETLSRDNTRKHDNEPQERQQKRQQAREPRSSDLFREHITYAKSSSEGSSPESEWGKQCNGEIDRRSREGNQVIGKRDIKRNEDKAWTQDNGISDQIRSGLSHNLGCNPQKQLGINLVIIGAQTRPNVYPKIEHVEEIEAAAKQAGIPIFEKDNLKPLLKRELRQELPL